MVTRWDRLGALHTRPADEGVSGAVLKIRRYLTTPAGGGREANLDYLPSARPPPDAKYVDVDLGKKGPTRGDLVYIRYPIFDERHERAGHSLTICEQFSRKRRLFYCQEEDHIRGRGTILSAGFQNLAALPITVLRVVGGTGDFKNARGQTMLDFAEGTVTFKLVP